MENDAVSREAVLEICEKMVWNGADDYDPISAAEIAKRVNKLPSAQPERAKGKWIYAGHDIAMCDGYMCDQCGFFAPWNYKHKFIDFIKDYHWCPSCGADMRGEEDGQTD